MRKGSAMAHKSSTSSETGEAIAADTPETREEMASKLVDRFALWSGVAGLIPVPVVDVFAVGGLQIQMVRRISQIYDVEFTENRGKALIASLAGAMIPATSGTLLNFNPPDYREFIKRQRDMWDSRKNRAAKSSPDAGATTNP